LGAFQLRVEKSLMILIHLTFSTNYKYVALGI